MELDELQVADHRPGAQRQRHPVAGGDHGVGRGGVHLAHAAAGQDHRRGADRADAVAGALAHHVEGDPAGPALVVGEQVEDEGVLDDLDARLVGGRLDQGPLDLGPGGVAAGVHDPVAPVAALAGELELAPGVAVEAGAVFHQALERVGALGDQDPHGLLVAEPGPGQQGVAQVLVRGVVRGEHGGDAALGPLGRPGRQHVLGDDQHAAGRGELGVAQRHGQTRDPGADHDHVGGRRPARRWRGQSAGRVVSVIASPFVNMTITRAMTGLIPGWPLRRPFRGREGAIRPDPSRDRRSGCRGRRGPPSGCARALRHR